MKKILVVDDEPAILNAFRSALERQGYVLRTTMNPAETVALAAEFDPDLVVLDVCMPEKDGFDVFRDLKEVRRHVPVLFVTAHPHSFDAESARVAELWTCEFSDGNVDIVYKPCDGEDLIGKVEGLIGPPGGD